MKTIWKYPIEIGSTVVEMPCDAEIVHTAVQGDEIMVWAVVSADAPPARRVFLTRETGERIDTADDDRYIDDHRYIGTVHLHAGRYVAHVFEVIA